MALTLDFSFLDDIQFYGRSISFKTALATLYEKTDGQAVTIVETGCIRSKNVHDLMGDGGSTFVLAQYVKKFGGLLVSVDIDDDHVNTAKEVIKESGLDRYVTFATGDSVTFLSNFTASIDLLYLDSYDTSYNDLSIIHEANSHQLKEIEAAYRCLKENSLVLSDDYPRKGKYTEDYLLNKGWLVYYRKDDQILIGH